MTIGPRTTLVDMAFIVGTALHNAGIEAVLSGGGAATVYAPDAYQSRDLDFVLGYVSATGTSNQCLIDLGFKREGNFFVHPESPFTLEFPPGPLMIGEEHVEMKHCPVLRREQMSLRILSPTDCVRDRLAWFLLYRNNPDFSALDQAIAVATRHPIDIERIKAWAASEGEVERYSYFESRYFAAQKPRTDS